jgi:hypothetical protein
VAIGLRTAHLLTMAVFLGGTFAPVPPPGLAAWRLGAALSGAGLLVTEVTHGSHWAVQVRGLFTVAHVAVLGLLLVDGLGPAGGAAAVVLGAVGSHMPRKLRKWSVRHRQVVD